jgi:iron complex transport system substrate-binding protein
MPRVVSLLPSATEIVCALGARESLVGRSHECDFPSGLESVPVLTRARVGGLPSSAAIDRDVRALVEQTLSIYEIDLEALARARPDVVVTQDLCDVCAVGVDDVRSALSRLSLRDTELVSLHPRTLADVLDDVRRVALALGADARKTCAELAARIEVVRRRAARPERPRVLTLEWLSPVMVGGLWMPELIELAGGTPLVTRAGQMAPTLGRVELEALDPDVVLVKPCGYDLERTASEVTLLRDALPWERWVRAGARFFLTDGNAYFNRSGPRLVESLEILAACLDPTTFAELAERHAGAVRSVTRELELLPAFDPP